MKIGSLSPEPPYAFDLLLAMLSRYAYPGVERVAGPAYRRTLRQPEGFALVEVRSTGSIDAPQLDVFLLAQQGQIDEAALLDQLSHILAVEVNRAAFFDDIARQEPLWEILAPMYGMPRLRSADLFEALTNVIIEQQIAWKTALRAQQWLIKWAGSSLSYEGETYHAYPLPQQIAAASIEDLTPLKITFKRMALLIDIAQRSLCGDLDALAQMTEAEAYQVLLQIKGIGHWTAAVALSRTLGAGAYIGENDVALQAAVNHYFYGGTGRIPAQQVVETFAPYGDYAGWAAHYTMCRWVLDRY